MTDWSDPVAHWGLQPVINVSGTMTTIGAASVRPEVIQAVGAVLPRYLAIEALQAKALTTLESKGVKLHRWSPKILAAFKKAWAEVAKEEGGGGFRLDLAACCSVALVLALVLPAEGSTSGGRLT